VVRWLPLTEQQNYQVMFRYLPIVIEVETASGATRKVMSGRSIKSSGPSDFEKALALVTGKKQSNT